MHVIHVQVHVHVHVCSWGGLMSIHVHAVRKVEVGSVHAVGTCMFLREGEGG